jgi:uncharacterized damage-inducible protein DinB
MSDQKPPRLVAGERETLMALLQYQRDSFARKLTGISDSDARRSLVASGTTLLWLLQHMAAAELLWIVGRFAGETVSIDDSLSAHDTVEACIAAYRATWARVDAIISNASLDDACRNVGDAAAANLRWVVMHLLEETARHAGHADILRELIDGSTGR